MLDILQLRVSLDEFDQLRLCQVEPPNDCHAVFTVKGTRMIWPLASWGEAPESARINVRGWFPLLDKMADEFLIWRPQGGCFAVERDRVTYRIAENDPRKVMFLMLELGRLAVVPARPMEPALPLRAYLAR